MAIQTWPQHSSVLGRESQHVFPCIKVLVGKAKLYLVLGKYEVVQRTKVADTNTSVCVFCVLGLSVCTLAHAPGLLPWVRNNNRSNHKLSKQSCGAISRRSIWKTVKEQVKHTHIFFPCSKCKCWCLFSPPPFCLSSSSPFLSLLPSSAIFTLSLSVSISFGRSNRHSVGGSQGGSPGCSRGGSLTNGDLNEEQISGPGSSARHRSSKSHVSPGSSAGIGKVC